MTEDKWAYKFGRKEGMRDLILMLEELCPHNMMKKDCGVCWNEIKKEYC